jgi:hypothetical protein
MDFAMSHTQVDDGQSSDEDSDHDGRNHYTGTQVDEGYFTRLAEGEDELNDDPALDEKGNQSAIDPVNPSVNMGGAVVHEVAERSGGDPETLDEVDEDIGDDDGSDGDTGTESVGMVDFCIADTQLPAAVRSEALPQQNVEPEESHLTVYDYLSLSAPASTGEVLNPSIAAKISSTPLIFTTTPADVHHTGTYGRSASNNGAFATATTGGASRPAGSSRANGMLLAPPSPQAEEPTQLDGSSLHGSGDTPEKAISGAADGEGPDRGAGGGDAAGGESETHASGPFSAEKALSNSRHLAEEARDHASMEKRTDAEIGETRPNTAAPVRTDTMSSGFATEWLSAKAPPKGTAKAAAYIAQRAAQPPPEPDTINRLAPAPAVASKTNAGTVAVLPEAVLVSTAPSALEERSLEELVLMQQQLQRLIEAKAQQQGSKKHEQQQEQAQVTSKEDTVAPLQRQDTSYGMSQPTNQTISGLIKLKAAAEDTLSPRSDANNGHNNYTTAAAAGAPAPCTAVAGADSTSNRARWYTPGPTVTADPTGNDPGAVAFSSPTVAEPTTGTTPSSAVAGKRFFRRKFAGTLAASPATTAAASSTTTSPAAAGAIAAPEQAPSVGVDDAGAGGAGDSDVSSPERTATTHGAKKVVPSPRSSPTKVKFNLPTDNAVAANASAQNSSAAKRPAPAGNGRARVSRVIQDDDVDADDAEAEFDDAQDASHGTKRAKVSAAEGTTETGSRGAASTSSSSSSNGAVTDAVDSYGLPDDLPVSFLRNLPDNFAQLWHTMQALGWHWKIGSGLVSYYYVRPKCAVKKGFLQGRDYFADEEGVWQFVRTVVAQCRSRMPASAPVRMSAPTAATIVRANAAGTSAHSIKPFAPTAVSGSAAVADTSAAASKTDVPAAAATNHSSALSEHPRALSALPASQSILQLPDDPAMRSIKDIPWKWLWKILKSKGWTWDYGPQHVNFYFAPGYNGKSKDAELNVHKFENEESVRRFIRKQNWPEFSGESLQRNTSMQAESQPPDAYLHDPTWQLASHRGKRPHAAPSKYDASAESGADSGADSENRAGAAAGSSTTAARNGASGGTHQQGQRRSKPGKEGGQSKRARVEASLAGASASASAAPGGRQSQDRGQAEFLYGQATQQQVLCCLRCACLS